MAMKLIMILMIVGFGFGLWIVDSIINKFENKRKKIKKWSGSFNHMHTISHQTKK